MQEVISTLRAVEFASLPWYAFFPFLGERLAAIFIHGALTSIVAVGLWRGRRAGIGAYLLAGSEVYQLADKTH